MDKQFDKHPPTAADFETPISDLPDLPTNQSPNSAAFDLLSDDTQKILTSAEKVESGNNVDGTVIVIQDDACDVNKTPVKKWLPKFNFTYEHRAVITEGK